MIAPDDVKIIQDQLHSGVARDQVVTSFATAHPTVDKTELENLVTSLLAQTALPVDTAKKPFLRNKMLILSLVNCLLICQSLQQFLIKFLKN